MIAYKYLSPKRINVIQDGHIRFTQPKYFNDPFEFKPVVDGLFSKQFLSSVICELLNNPAAFKKHLTKKYIQFYLSNSELMRHVIFRKIAFLNLYTANDNSFRSLSITKQEEVVIEYVSALLSSHDISSSETIFKQLQMIESLLELNPVVFALLHMLVSDHMMKFSVEQAPVFESEFYETVNKTLGVLSLSSICDNLLMWTHYAGDGAGYVIGFDLSHPFFDQRRSADDLLRHIRAVKYTEDRPHITLTDFVLEDLANNDRKAIFLDTFMFTKSNAWSYEAEWRMVFELKDADVVLAEKDTYLFRIPDECIKQIIIGYQASNDLETALVEYAKSGRFNNLSLFKASIDARDYCLSFEDLSESH